MAKTPYYVQVDRKYIDDLKASLSFIEYLKGKKIVQKQLSGLAFKLLLRLIRNEQETVEKHFRQMTKQEPDDVIDIEIEGD